MQLFTLSSRHIVFLPLLIVILVGAISPREAHALGGNELQVTVGPGYSGLPDVGEGLDGVGAGLEISYAFTALWRLAAGGFFAHHFAESVPGANPDDPPTRYASTSVTAAWVGPQLALDYFTVIPYVSLAPEILVTRGELQEDQSELDFALRWTLGFDYRPSRLWSMGFEVNYHSFLRQPLDYPIFITTMFRVSLHHDFSGL